MVAFVSVRRCTGDIESGSTLQNETLLYMVKLPKEIFKIKMRIFKEKERV